MWTLPEKDLDCCTLTMGKMRFVVAPKLGGRIIEFSSSGNNVLMPLQDLGDWTNGGSTFWTSPQTDWGWPPEPTLDRGPYSVSFDRERQALTLQSAEVRLAGSTVSVTKRFAPNLERHSIELDYRITNHGRPLKLAPWEVSRVPAKGFSFFRGTALRALGGLPAPLHDVCPNGVVYMAHDKQAVEAKLGADASSPFVAYASRSLLFVKTLRGSRASLVASGEAELELYVKPGAYVEIEQQGPLELLAPGQACRYQVSWYLRELPPYVDSSSMNPGLVEFTRQVSGAS